MELHGGVFPTKLRADPGLELKVAASPTTGIASSTADRRARGAAFGPDLQDAHAHAIETRRSAEGLESAPPNPGKMIEALAFILTSSKPAREAMLDVVRFAREASPSDLVFATQVSGDDAARPDLVGRDEHGREPRLRPMVCDANRRSAGGPSIDRPPCTVGRAFYIEDDSATEDGRIVRTAHRAGARVETR